jgi:hypothetical protein
MIEIIILAILLLIIIIIMSRPNAIEKFVDPYSIDLQADALNRMARWNTYSSRHMSSLNFKIVPPPEHKCYYWQY